MSKEPDIIQIDRMQAYDPIKKDHFAYLITQDRKCVICLEMTITYHFITPTATTPLVSEIDSASARIMIGELAFNPDETTLNEWLKFHTRPYEYAKMFPVNPIKAPSLVEDEINDQMKFLGFGDYSIYIMDIIRYYWKQSYVYNDMRE